MADRLAHRLPSETVLDYIPLTEGPSLQEIAIPDAWLGETLRELELPKRYGMQVVAVYDVFSGIMNVVPDPDDPLREADVAIVAGAGADRKVSEMLEEAR